MTTRCLLLLVVIIAIEVCVAMETAHLRELGEDYSRALGKKDDSGKGKKSKSKDSKSGKKSGGKKESKSSDKKYEKTNDPIPLDSFPQWRGEVGYWVGEYTFYQGDGTPNESRNWNYPYDSYKGFITGNIQGLAYRQRNVFLYPPQTTEKCAENDSVVGEGTCGVNGNSRIFYADQVADEELARHPDYDGSISGPFAGLFDTKTELIGADNALLYQVFLDGALFQSQLTTLTVDSDNVQRRTRSAQSFRAGVPSSMSFYREYQVSREDFYQMLAETLVEYNLIESDICAWQDNYDFTPGAPPYAATVYTPGFDGCMEHLESSFECFACDHN